MKKLSTFFAVILIAITVLAQSPEKMSYQCVIRNSGGVLVTNQSVGIRISILRSTSTGTVVYLSLIHIFGPLTVLSAIC